MKEDFKSQVEGRLDEIFGKDGEGMEPMERLGRSGDHPLKALKARLLSIEWEITDSSMNSLLVELRNLEGLYKDDQVVLTFIRLLCPIAKYIKARKGNSHPQATGVLNSVYHGLEKVALSEAMSSKEKERILLQEVAKFRKLKEEVIQLKEKRKQETMGGGRASQEEGKVVSSRSSEPDLTRTYSPEFLARALDEIKELIRAEFKSLREEVKRSKKTL